MYIKTLPIFEAPLPSRFLIFVKDNKIPKDVEIIISQKKFEVKLYFSRYWKLILIYSEIDPPKK